MALVKIDRNPPQKVLKQFGLVLPILGLIIGGFLVYKWGAWNIAVPLLAVLTVVGIIGWFVPRFMKPIFVGWLYLTFPIAWVISHMILLATFYGVIFPIGLLLKAMGKDPLDRKWLPQEKSYWKPHPQAENRSRYFRQF